MEDETAISGIRVGLEETSEVPVGGEMGGFTTKKDNQTRLCPLQGRRIFGALGGSLGASGAHLGARRSPKGSQEGPQ